MKKMIWTAMVILLLMAYPGCTLTLESKNDDTWLTEDQIAYCIEIGKMYNVCPEFLMAIIETESWGNPTVYNGVCKGLMQVSEKWHKGRMKKLGVSDLYDEYSNILVGTDYLTELFAEYEDPALCLMIYHGESDAFEKAEKGIMSGYAKKILERSEYLERLHESVG